MTGQELYDARATIGFAWGLNRPLHMSEMGRLLKLSGRDVGQSIRDWERREGPTGPASVAISAMIDGWRPSDWKECLTPRG